MDDFELIRGILSGDKRAWDKFVLGHTNLVYTAIIRALHKNGHYSKDPHVLLILHNDVFIKFYKDNYKALRSFQGRKKCKLSTFVWTVARNKTIDYLCALNKDILNNQMNIQVDTLSKKMIQDLSDNPIEKRMHELDAKLITQTLLNYLPDRQRKLCQLYYIDDLEAEEVARALGISVDYFYVEKQRVLKKLNRLSKKEKII